MARASAPKLVALTVFVVSALLALTAASAQALVTRPYRSQITKANNVPFARPFGLGVDSADNLWVSDKGTHSVSKFDSAGVYQAQNDGTGSWGATEYLESLAFSAAAGEVFVSDSNHDDIWALDPTTAAFTGKDLRPLGASECCFLKVAADNSGGATGGDLYVSTGSSVIRIKVSNGAADDFTAGPAAGTNELTGPFTSAGALAVDAAGDLFVAGTKAVYEFEPSGEFTGTEFAEAEGAPLAEISAVAVDPTDGNILVAQETSVLEFSPAGTYLRRITKARGAPLLFVRGLAFSSTGTLYVADANANVVDVFGPLVTLPDVTTGEAAVASTTAATVHGEVNPAGLPVTECFFEYDTTPYGPEEPPHGQSAPCEPPAASIPADEAGHLVEAQLTDLAPGATYHFRLVAANANGANSESADHVFFTGAGIDSTSASAVTATSARLETELNPHGLATTYHFEYDTAPYAEGGGPHGIALATASAGSGTVDIAASAPIQALMPATIYHYRVVAENSLGVVEGPDRAFTTQGVAPSALLDGRAWEMVSPPEKSGIPLEANSDEAGTTQAAADGSGFAYLARGAINAEAPGNRSFFRTQLLAHRGPDGWSTEDVSAPHEEVQGITTSGTGEFRFFSPDLSVGGVRNMNTRTLLSPFASERTPYLRLANGEYIPLIVGCPAPPSPCPEPIAAHANVPPGTVFGGELSPGGQLGGNPGAELVAANPKLSHPVFTATVPLITGLEGTKPSLYQWSAGALRLISQIPGGGASACGGGGPSCIPAADENLNAFVGTSDQNVRHAISTNGNRVIFSAAGSGDKQLFLRDTERSETIQLNVPEPGAQGGFPNTSFETANADDSRVFFTDGARLTPGSRAAGETEPDLYMCEIEETIAGHLTCHLTDLTVPTQSTEAAAVRGTVIGASENGDSVYFVANGVLAAGASPGSCTNYSEAGEPGIGSCNLYIWHEGTVSFIAALTGGDEHDWLAAAFHNDLRTMTSRVSPNGRWLAFMSEAPLTGYDNRDARSGERDEEVFLYHSAGTGEEASLRCVSCNPTGARPVGFRAVQGKPPFPLSDSHDNWGGRWVAASIPSWPASDSQSALYQPRYLSDSGRLFFNSFDALTPLDSNGVGDVYEYEPPRVGDCTQELPTFRAASGGCLALISSGGSSEESAFLDASENGDDVFFLTASRLSLSDVDSALDVYDAHVCSTASPCPPPQAVRPSQCDGDACQQPAVPPVDPTPGSLTFNGAGNLTECPKGKVKKSGKCVARKHHKSKGNKKTHKRATKSKRGAGK